MGATSFQTGTYFGKTVEDAYRAAVESAQYESGHDPYNGTISTTSGVVVADETPSSMKKRIARVLEEKRAEVRRLRALPAKRRDRYEVEDARGAVADLVALKKRYRVAGGARALADAYLALELAGERVPFAKWGCALAIPLSGKELREKKAANGLKGTRRGAWLFVGIAAM